MRDWSASRWGSSKSVIFATFVAALASVPASTIGAPLILEPTSSIPMPESRFPWPHDVAIDGDYILLGTGYQYSLAPYEDYDVSAAFLYRRENARKWTLVRKLAETDTWLWDDDVPTVQVAMRNGIAALTWYGLPLQVFERSGSNWLNVPAEGELQGTELEIDGTTILASEETCGWGAEAYRKNSSGIWAAVDLYEGVYRGCDGEQLGGEVDISGNIVVVPQPMSDEPDYVPVSYVWEGIPTNDPPTVIGNAGPITVSGDTIAQLSTRDGVSGVDIYRRQSRGVWNREQFIVQPDALLTRPGGDLQMEDGFLMHTRDGNVEMFQRDSTGQFKFVAKLLGAGNAHISQRRVVAAGNGVVNV